MKKTWLVVMLLIFILAQSALAHERTWPAKRLKKIWPEAEKFTSKQVTLSASQIEHLEKDGIKLGTEDKTPTFYFAQVKDEETGKLKALGTIVFIDEYGANGKMEISVGTSPSGKVSKLGLWQHSEPSSLDQESFLKEFFEKTYKDSFAEDKDYELEPKAKEGSKAVARAVKKALALTHTVFGKSQK